MLDLRFVRENIEQVMNALEKRGYESTFLDEFLKIENERRLLLQAAENNRQERNKISKEIGELRKRGEDTSKLLNRAKDISSTIKEQEDRLAFLEEEIKNFLLNTPNIPNSSVPFGKSDEDNVEIKRWGEIKRFSFPPKNHWDIGEALGILDFERGAKIAGSRFTLYKGSGARLERALIN